jgi:hypothetical protein
MNTISLKNSSALMILPCATSGCAGHVVYDSKPLPSLNIPLNAMKDFTIKQRRVYLACDNLVAGPHKNIYIITQK